ncbi:MFS transporter [Amycolatopsis rhabdoformis]|uniref:MFS transporter n=1 Tax=Amycolatopsis rhabdoformis TaxID=1448059 RepID=A0ABZ1HZY2_9PSEU|nr:MFS transporter [Amycolatopsis rhabdoformis]WSE27107.1 MFS transporter [Amycolatopsis rhabdoformis]
MTRLPPAYWRLWWAAGITNVGDGAFTSAVPLLAVSVTRDPRLISLVTAAAFVPWLLLALPAGAWADRHDRVRLMKGAQLAQAVVAGALALTAAHGGIAVLIVAALALGAGDVVFGTASQAFLPDIVPKPLLPRANGSLQAATTIGVQFAGPPLGSLLFALAPALPFGLDAVSFAGSAALIPTPPGRSHRTKPKAPIAEGLRWLARHRLLRTLTAVLGVNTFCGQLANATLVLLATQTLHVSPRGYGLLLASAAVGSVTGGLVNARIVARIGPAAALITSLAVNAAVFAAIGLAPNALVLGGLLAVNGFVTTLWNIVNVSLRQSLVPAALLGRVTSVHKLLGWGLIPLGTLTGGLLAASSGLRAPYPVAGTLRGLALLVALPVLLSARNIHRTGTEPPAPPAVSGT